MNLLDVSSRRSEDSHIWESHSSEDVLSKTVSSGFWTQLRHVLNDSSKVRHTAALQLFNKIMKLT